MLQLQSVMHEWNKLKGGVRDVDIPVMRVGLVLSSLSALVPETSTCSSAIGEDEGSRRMRTPHLCCYSCRVPADPLIAVDDRTFWLLQRDD